MDRVRNVLDQVEIRPVILPIDLAAGANNGLWVPMRNFDRIAFLFFGEIGTADQDPILTFRQAKTSAGGDAKNLATVAKAWVKENDGALPADWTVVTQDAGATFSTETGGESNQLYLIEVRASDLDVSNDFDFVTVNIADTGATAGKLGCMVAIGFLARYASDRPATAA